MYSLATEIKAILVGNNGDILILHRSLGDLEKIVSAVLLDSSGSPTVSQAGRSGFLDSIEGRSFRDHSDPFLVPAACRLCERNVTGAGSGKMIGGRRSRRERPPLKRLFGNSMAAPRRKITGLPRRPCLHTISPIGPDFSPNRTQWDSVRAEMALLSSPIEAVAVGLRDWAN